MTVGARNLGAIGLACAVAAMAVAAVVSTAAQSPPAPAQGAPPAQAPAPAAPEATPPAAAAPTQAGRSPLDPNLMELISSIESRLETIRGLKFTKPVETSALSREGVRAFLTDLLHREYPPAEIEAEEIAMRYFGLIEAGQKLESLFLDVMQQQVAGLYDPDSKILFVVPGPVAGSVTLAHELAHALVDQHFDIAALERRIREDDDRALAVAALVEGEATMVMTLWAAQSGADPLAQKLIGGDTDEALEAAQAGLGSVPPFLREQLLFPYLAGAKWVAEVMRRGGGPNALDPFFKTPPDSTEQILHPAKSFAPRDLPSSIDKRVADAALPKGAVVVKRDSLGELGIRLLLDKGESAAEGWDGDDYVIAGDPDHRTLAWASAWDTEADAQEFREAILVWLAARAKAAGLQRSYAAVRQGKAVIVVEGSPPGAPAAAERASKAYARLSSGVQWR